jgi:protease II
LNQSTSSSSDHNFYQRTNTSERHRLFIDKVIEGETADATSKCYSKVISRNDTAPRRSLIIHQHIWLCKDQGLAWLDIINFESSSSSHLTFDISSFASSMDFLKDLNIDKVRNLAEDA